MNWIAYEKPESLSEALTLLEKAGGKGRLIAGGTDLVLQMKRGAYHADLLVDITGIPGLKKIEEEEGWIRIGASVTHAEVAKHPLIRREAKALSEGCDQMGSPQIRNSGDARGQHRQCPAGSRRRHSPHGSRCRNQSGVSRAQSAGCLWKRPIKASVCPRWMRQRRW